MNVNTKFFKLMGTDIPILFSAGAISKWLMRIEKAEADIAKIISTMNDHEVAQLVYAGMEYGYGVQGVRCPWTFYEVEDYLLEGLEGADKQEFDDLLIYAMECVTGRVDRIAKKNGIDLNMSAVAKKMRENFEEAKQKGKK